MKKNFLVKSCVPNTLQIPEPRFVATQKKQGSTAAKQWL